MKIIFICTNPITFNTFLRSQANYFIKKGFDIEVACSAIDKLNFIKSNKYEISFPNKILSLFNLFVYLKIFIQINILVKKNPNAVFYLHTPIASYLFRFFTIYKKLKVIYFVHGFRFTANTIFFKKIFFQIIEKILSYKTKIFITINNEDFHYAKNYLNKKAKVYKVNGVGLNLNKKYLKKEFSFKKSIKKILVISAYKKDKGYYEILKVAELLKDKKIRIDCYGYGKADKFNIIKNKKKLQNIYFKKFDVNLENKIYKYDILLHLSLREGLPVSLMQSLSKGLPILCYKIRGNKDLVVDGFNGYFIKSFKDIPNIISYLNLKNDHYIQLSINAYNTINKYFSINKINLDLYKIIKKIYGKKKY